MRSVLVSILLLSLSVHTVAQVINTTTMDTVETTIIGHVGLGGYVDAYYGYNFNQPVNGRTPYLVSSADDNQFAVNLAYVDVRYRSKFMRVRFVPGFGTYMDANYQGETGSMRHMVEANIGILVSSKRNIWIDAGVLGSPYTNESGISKDHLMYTRSMGSENSPYYLSGVKASIPLSQKVNAYLYLINGWQVIQDNNAGKSFGTQLEYRPNNVMLFNWNTYIGDERSSVNPEYRTRYFTDVYWIYKSGRKWSATSSAYMGIQDRSNQSSATWWQINAIGKYNFNNQVSLSARLEYFHDPESIIVSPNSGFGGFRTMSYGLCANLKLHKLAVFRLEARKFESKDNVYSDHNGAPTASALMLITSLTAWF